jgi:diacylglycerol kinase (ATP)
MEEPKRTTDRIARDRPSSGDSRAAGTAAKNQPFRRRLGFAAAGIAAVAARERSFRTQALLAAAAVTIVAGLRPGLAWAALLALSIGLVLALECLNAALEYALDRLHPELDPEIGRAKDAAAGAVLIASLAAASVGALMLIAGRAGPSPADPPAFFGQSPCPAGVAAEESAGGAAPASRISAAATLGARAPRRRPTFASQDPGLRGRVRSTRRPR